MTEFVFKENGDCVKRTVSEHPIEINPDIEKLFQANAAFRLSNVADFGQLCDKSFGPASLSTRLMEQTIHWSIHIHTLHLNTAFVLNGDKELVPAFDQFKDESKVMSIPWTPPIDMKLVLGISVNNAVSVNNADGVYRAGKHYLIAYDSHKRTWRLPLSNLYDHLELCHGQNPVKYATSMEAVCDSLKRFRSSLWNADLFGDFQKFKTPLMFRFKPNDKGFEQMPTNANWTAFCEKVSNDFINTNFMPV